MRLAATAASLLLAASATPAPARAEVPRVLADTPPVHSLVATVMGGLGEPALVVRSGTSPHDSALSPSQAEALTEPDLIVWTGPAFLPWMGEAIAALAPEARTLALLEADGWDALPARASLHLGEEGPEGEAHDHEHGHDHDHAEGGIDPHAWLDPAVAADWLGLIAEALAAEDPANAATYRANAEAGAAEMARLGQDLRARLGPLAGRDGGEGGGYAVGHDAYQYLERAAGLPANWAVARADGAAAAPGDVAALRDAVLAGEVSCLLVDAETDPAWAATLGEGAALRTARVDPDGVSLEPGPELYPALMEGIAAALEACLAP